MKNRQERFLAAFEVCGNISLASRSAKVHRETHYYWMANDPTYPPRFEQVSVRAVQALEDEAVRRAVHGVKTPVLYQGKQVYIQGMPYYETHYSDRLLIRLLEVRDPEGFGRGKKTSGKIDLDKLTPAELDDLKRLARKCNVSVETAADKPESVPMPDV